MLPEREAKRTLLQTLIRGPAARGQAGQARKPHQEAGAEADKTGSGAGRDTESRPGMFSCRLYCLRFILVLPQ